MDTAMIGGGVQILHKNDCHMEVPLELLVLIWAGASGNRRPWSRAIRSAIAPSEHTDRHRH